jgi:TolB-like protein
VERDLGKEIRTCWRWEKELGLPVHRIDSTSSRSRVFAYKAEIDAWLRRRADHDGSSRPLLSRTGFRVAIAGVVLLAAFVVVFHFWFRPARRNRSLPPVTIAVLPFADKFGPKQEAYYSEGIVDEIIKSLRAYDRIAVIPFPFATAESPLYEKPGVVGRELGLNYLLKGTLSRRNGHISLEVDFVKAGADRPVWAADYREPLRNLGAVKDDLQTRICRTLGIKKSRLPAEAGRTQADGASQLFENYVKGSFVLARLEAPVNNPWLLYYQGKFFCSQFTAADNELAIGLFRRALEADPSYARAYIGLADCYTNYVSFNWEENVHWLDKAEQLLNKAQALEPDLPEYFGALLVVLLNKQVSFGQDQQKTFQDLADEGLGKYPNDQQLNSIVGTYYWCRYGQEGRPEDLRMALEYKRRAFWLNPYAFNNINYAQMLLCTAEFDKAVEVCRQAEKTDSSLMVHFLQAEVLYYQGDLDRAWSILQAYESLPRMHTFALYYMAMIAARRGQAGAARKILAEIDLIAPEEFKYFPSRRLLASAYLGLGDTDRGFKFLAEYLSGLKTANDRFVEYGYIDLDPNFTRFRKDPRFLEILNAEEDPKWLNARRSK